MRRLTRNLRDSSVEAFIMALGTINNPSIAYRLEAFLFLFCNAWELLTKARLLEDGSRIFYQKQRGKPRRSLSLADSYDFYAVRKAHAIDSKERFFYRSRIPGHTPQYSAQFVDWLVSRFKRDPQFFQKARQRLKQS